MLTGTDTRKAECKKRIEVQKIRRATINILIYTIAVGRFKMTMETRTTVASHNASAWNGKHLEDWSLSGRQGRLHRRFQVRTQDGIWSAIRWGIANGVGRDGED